MGARNLLFLVLLVQYGSIYLGKLKKKKIKLKKNNGILIHGGGWKKMQKFSVNNSKFKRSEKFTWTEASL